MNNTCALVPLTINVPAHAVGTIQNLVRILCGQSAADEKKNWVDSQPLPDNVRPGKLLRAARLRADMTQKELALKIGVPQTHISQYEKNKRKIPPQKAKELAALLETAEEYFR